MVFLWKYLLIEEILGLYLVPIFAATVIAGLCFLPIRIFKPIRYQKVFAVFIVIACILQVFILRKIFQINPSQFFNKEQITGDIDYAVQMLEDVHPDPYSIISKEDFYRKVDSMKNILPETISEKDANKVISKIYALIKDGHTGVRLLPPKIPFKFLPYKFKITDEKIFVARNFCYRNVIPLGSEIISINGMTSRQYIQETSRLFSWENLSWRNTRLQYPMLWELWDDFRNYKVIYKTPEGKTKTIRTSGGFFSVLQIDKESKQQKLHFKYHYKLISDSIGYIKFNSFSDLEQFKIFLDSTFTSIKNENVRHLIIDIRNNGGGSSSLGDELMQYISKKDFKQVDSCSVKISKELINKNKLDWIDSVERKAGTLYTVTDSLIKLRDNPLRFTGKSYLLVGGNTFSSASMFASAFQCFEVGTIIGTETGGLTVCFGDLYFYDLPETEFNMSLSHKKFYQVCGKDDRRGIIPDYIVENSIEDDAKSFDRVLDFTLELINKSKIAP